LYDNDFNGSTQVKEEGWTLCFKSGQKWQKMCVILFLLIVGLQFACKARGSRSSTSDSDITKVVKEKLKSDENVALPR
jgi:hypothetical protein